MALFGKKKSKEPEAPADAPPADGGEATPEPPETPAETGQTYDGNPRKARRFFDHAEAAAETRNYDYSVELYIDGLRQDPDNMDRHEQLLDIAKHRKVAGGKKPGIKDKLKSSGGDAVSKMLDAERLWAMDFGDPASMREFMKRAVEADRAYDNLHLGEVAYWIGCMALEMPGPKPKAKDYVQVRDHFAAVGRFDKAIEACKKAIRLDMNNQNLLAELKNLEAEHYAATNTSTDQGGFRDNVADAEQALASQQGNTRALSAVDQAIAKRRAEYEEDPEDVDRLAKLVDALLKKEDYDAEEEAIKLLGVAHEQTGQYRHKVRVGDVKIKQLNRELRDMRKNLEVDPENDYFTGRLEEIQAEKTKFELGEYQERVKNYPTDLKLKFELGKRMYQAGLIDEAIGLLQDAKREPKSKGQAFLLLGRCFVDKNWLDEAIDTFADGIAGHPIPDDTLGKELRYHKMTTLLASAEKAKKVEQAEEASALASELLQADINYKDIMDQKKKSAALLEELRG